jgi:hypothetical protein
MSLGELHRSTGKRKWKALTYAGRVKYGNQRGALLNWMKSEMVPPMQGPQLPAANPRPGPDWMPPRDPGGRWKPKGAYTAEEMAAYKETLGIGRWARPKTKRLTKAQMRRQGYNYDLYTGEPL